MPIIPSKKTETIFLFILLDGIRYHSLLRVPYLFYFVQQIQLYDVFRQNLPFISI